jgi:hypothetical protein
VRGTGSSPAGGKLGNSSTDFDLSLNQPPTFKPTSQFQDASMSHHNANRVPHLQYVSLYVERCKNKPEIATKALNIDVKDFYCYNNLTGYYYTLQYIAFSVVVALI